MSRGSDAVTAACLVLAVVFGPLAFGAVEPWAYSVLAVLACTALFAAVVHAVFEGGWRRLVGPMLIPGVLAVALLAAQTVSWPTDLLERVTAKTVAMHGLQGAVTGGDLPERLSPSLYGHATRGALICLSSYVALFAATCAYVRSRRRLTHLAGILVSVGFAVALLGILHSLSGARSLYWLREPSHGGACLGPFVSRNQFGAYVALSLFAGLGLLLMGPVRDALSPKREDVGVPGATSAQTALLGFAVSVCGAAVFWSLSTGAILSIFVAGFVLLVGLTGLGFRHSKLPYVGAVAVAVAGWVAYLGVQPVIREMDRLRDVAQNPSATWRWQMMGDALHMGTAFPVTGTGAGTFLSVYPYFRTLPTNAVTRSPHNEYLHVFAETGVTGLALLALAIVFVFVSVGRKLSARRDPTTCGFALGGIAALVAVMAHSMVDFPMRSPAIAATVAVLVGLLFADTRPGQAGRAQTRRKPGAGSLLVLLPFCLVWLLACHLALNPLRGQLEGRVIDRMQERVSPETGNVVAFLDATEHNLRAHSAGDAQLYSDLADFADSAAVTVADPGEKLHIADRSLKLRMTAARLEPLNADHPFRIAVQFLRLGRVDLGAVYGHLACKLLPNDPWVRARLAKRFSRHGYPEAAQYYLDQAAEKAETRGIDAIGPLLADIRGEMGRWQGEAR